MKGIESALMMLVLAIAMHGCSTIFSQTMQKTVICEVRP